jgi:hypothetical protein
MIRFFCVALFFSIFYTACFFCPAGIGNLKPAALEFVKNSYTGDIRMSGGQELPFELALSRDSTHDSFTIGLAPVAFAFDCPVDTIGVKGRVSIQGKPLVDIEISGSLRYYGTNDFRLTFSGVDKSHNVSHDFRITLTDSLRFAGGSYSWESTADGSTPNTGTVQIFNAKHTTDP